MNPQLLPLSEPVLNMVGACLLHFVWQGALVAAGLACIMAFLRKSAASTRYVILFAGLLLMAVLPVTTMAVLLPPALVDAVPTVHTAEPPAHADGAVTTPGVATAAPSPLPTTAVPAAAQGLHLPNFAYWKARIGARLDPYLPGVAALWLFGVCLLGFWNLGGWVQTQRLRFRNVARVPEQWNEKVRQLCARLGVRRPVFLLESGRVSAPMVVGLIRPLILLPAAVLTGLTPDQVHAVLAHELAHVRRHDYAANLLQTAIETLLFYHPAVWWVSRRIREERENCCDDMAVQHCGDSLLYARALADLAGQCGAAAPLAVAASGGVLLRRVERIVGAPEPRAHGWAPLLTVVCFVFALSGIYGLHSAKFQGRGAFAAQSALMGQVEDFAVDSFHKVAGFLAKKEKPKVAVGGIIVDESGTPVKDVHVSLYFETEMAGMSNTADAVTDAAGHWETKIPKGLGHVSWHLQHPDFALSTTGSWIPVSEELLAGKLRSTIEHGARLRGVVVDEAGAAIKDAVLVRGFTNIEEIAKYREEIRSGKTSNAVIADAEGRFIIPFEAGKDSDLYVFAENLAPQCLRVGKDTGELRIVLGKGRTWSGTIRDASGAPMEGARIASNMWTIQRGHTYNAVYTYQTQTDASGTFTLSALPDVGSLDFGAGKKGYFRRDIDWTATGENETELVLYPGAELQGRVVDAVTGKPVKYFTVDFEQSQVAVPVASYWCHNPVKYRASDGKFSVETGASMGKVPGAVQVRITSENYYTAFVDPLYATEFASKPPEIRMEPAEPVTGVVQLPDGKTAKDAFVALVEPDQVACIEKASLNTNIVGTPYNRTTTDGKGRFHLSPIKGPALILALHESGWAVRPLAEHRDANPLALSAWSQLEGSLPTQERPKGEKAYVAVNAMLPKEWNAGTSVRFSLGAAADAAGHFKVDHVPALPMKVGEQRRWVTSHAVDVSPEPGKTVQVGFCTEPVGRVQGRLMVDAAFAVPAGDSAETWYSSRRLFIAARRHGADPKDEYGSFIPLVQDDGTFTLDCLSPGDYDLKATLHDMPPEPGCGRGTAAARVERAFSIVPNQSAPVALGELPFETIPRPASGAAAPAIEGTTLDGKPWKLSDERGTPVLLVYWATWCAPCKAELPTLKALWKRYGESGKLRIIGLNLDRELKDAAKFVAKEELPWPQYNVGAWSEDNPVTTSYGVSYIPSNWLIDASGNIVESRIAADALASVLERHLK